MSHYLFAGAGRYDVAARLAQGAGEILPDAVSVHRGMAPDTPTDGDDIPA